MLPLKVEMSTGSGVAGFLLGWKGRVSSVLGVGLGRPPSRKWARRMPQQPGAAAVAECIEAHSGVVEDERHRLVACNWDTPGRGIRIGPGQDPIKRLPVDAKGVKDRPSLSLPILPSWSAFARQGALEPAPSLARRHPRLRVRSADLHRPARRSGTARPGTPADLPWLPRPRVAAARPRRASPAVLTSKSLRRGRCCAESTQRGAEIQLGRPHDEGVVEGRPEVPSLRLAPPHARGDLGWSHHQAPPGTPRSSHRAPASRART